jgi:uncharacterized membrane protein YkoI
MNTLIVIISLALLLSGPANADSELLMTRVSLDQATHQIIIQNQFRVLSARTEIIDGKEIHIIKVLTPNGHVRHFKIDAESGNRIN